MSTQNINPTIVYVSMLILVVLLGIGEYFKIVPTGYAILFLGGLLGHGISAVSANTATKDVNTDVTTKQG